MLSLDSPDVYLLMGAAVAFAFMGARLVRGRPAFFTREPIDWRPARPQRSHVVGSVLFGIGWAITDACPGPTAAQLGAGRLLAVAVAGGIIAGVWLQPALTGLVARLRSAPEVRVRGVQGAEVL